ncbi:type IV pilus modification PilV family protein [Cellulomonas sp. URHB0016]
MKKALGARTGSDDSGFSLIEVVVALFLLGVVAAAALSFFVRAMQNTSHLQRSQASVAVANQAMELVRSVTPREVDTVNHVSGLLIGRTAGATDAAWLAYPADVAQMNKVSDAWAATRGASLPIPVVKTYRVSNMDYKVTTLIGTCYRPATASTADQTCVKTGASGDVLLYRVTVVVAWKSSKAGSCTAAACEYRTSTLVDPTLDANWNLTAKPVAYDDAISSVAGTTTSLPTDVLVNDVMGAVTANPTTITQNPAFGTAAPVTSGTGMGSITYTPGNFSGITFLKYKLKDAAGRQSNEATVTITVNPKAVADTATATAGGPDIDIDVLFNDLGTGLTIVPVSGGGTVTGGMLHYTPSTYVGDVTLKYKVQDSSGLESTTVNVVVTQQTPVTPSAGTPSIAVSFSGVATTANLDLLNKTLNSPTYTIQLLGQPTSGTVSLNSPTNTAATFNQVAGQVPGNYTFPFTVTNPAGPKVSSTGTYTITVSAPVATAEGVFTLRKGDTPPVVAVGTNDTPVASAWNTKLKIALISGSSDTNCGSVSIVDANAGTVKITPKTSILKACTFTYSYRLESTSGTSFSSNTVVNSVTVNL